MVNLTTRLDLHFAREIELFARIMLELLNEGFNIFDNSKADKRVSERRR